MRGASGGADGAAMREGRSGKNSERLPPFVLSVA